MTAVKQFSFSGGEVSPSLYGRVDLVKYQTGLKKLRNFIVARHGGAYNRPGLKFVAETRDPTKESRLIPFVFNDDQTYILEFGDQYMRVIRNGALVTEFSNTITSITNASPAVVTYATTNHPANGDEIVFSGIIASNPMAMYLNGRNFIVSNVNTGAKTFELKYLDGTNVDSTSWGTYFPSGIWEKIYSLSTPYSHSDLAELQFVQSADVVTIVHPSYAPRELSRLDHDNWVFSTISFVPNISRPTGVTGSVVTGGGINYRYRVTAVKADTYEESLAGFGANKTITGATQANPVQITATAHGYTNGDQVYISGISGMTELNNRYFTITTAGVNAFTLDGENGSSYTAYTSGGISNRVGVTLASVTLSTTNTATVTWTKVTGAVEYNVYREQNGVFGFIGIAGTTSFTDTGITPDIEDTPPLDRTIFNSAGNYPSCVTYYQQRRIYANTDLEPEKVFASRISQFNNFSNSSPIQDDDAITWTMAGRQVNEVRHLVDVGQLVVFTQSGEWAIGGNDAGILIPGQINPKQHSYNGSKADLSPIVINGNILYVQARGSAVRDLGFDYQIDGYRGNDLTIFSNHLFDSYTLKDWSYQQIPHSVVWVVRNDGALLGLTYVREHQIWAWHRHDTDGKFKNACVIPDGDEDFLYTVVERTINGQTKKYIERMSTRQVIDIKDSTLVDSYLTYDGRNTSSITMTLSGGTTWDYTETLTLTASFVYFNTAVDPGKQIHITAADGSLLKLTLIADGTNSSTQFKCRASKTVPSDMRNSAFLDWCMAVNQVTGLWHIEGKSVSVLGDGFVVASPNNPAYTILTVTNGTIDLGRHYSVIHAGLPITNDFQTLNIDTNQGETLADKNTLINEVAMYVEKSRGIWVGGKEPSGNTLEDLREIKVRSTESYDFPVDLKTDVLSVTIKSEWNSSGSVFVRQVDPVPLSILTIVPIGLIPFRG